MITVDRAIAFTILNRGWGLISGPITLFFIVRYLSIVEQGYYYTFGSVLGLQVFFEMGLGFVVLQTVSHLMAHLRIRDNRIEGDDESIGRLGALLVGILIWYTVLCFLFVTILMTCGSIFFGYKHLSDSVSWQLPWMILVPVFGAGIITNALFSYLEGMGFISELAFVRLVQSIFSMIVVWLALYSGYRLLALALMYFVNFLIAILWISIRYGRLLRYLVVNRSKQNSIDWGNEIWPLQWRIAISWIAGYLGTQAIIIIVFNQLGAVEAGRIGLSMTIIGAASSGAMAWVTTKSYQFGRLVARRNYTELNELFAISKRGAYWVAVLAGLGIVSMVWLIDLLRPDIAQRFPPIEAIIAMVIGMVMNVTISTQAIYLRAFRREPFMLMSVVSGTCITVSTFILTHILSLTMVIIGNTCITLLIGYLWCRPLFKQCKTEFTRI